MAGSPAATGGLAWAPLPRAEGVDAPLDAAVDRPRRRRAAGTKRRVDRTTASRSLLYWTSWRVLPTIFVLAGAGMIGGIGRLVAG
jgi:hypothetical protein